VPVHRVADRRVLVEAIGRVGCRDAVVGGGQAVAVGVVGVLHGAAAGQGERGQLPDRVVGVGGRAVQGRYRADQAAGVVGVVEARVARAVRGMVDEVE